MNNAATSRGALLEVALCLAAKDGLDSLNIRNIAKHGNISVGCVYNYFPSKANLIAETVAKIWEDIFHPSKQCGRPQGFQACVRWIFDSIRNGSKRYPSFFIMHGMSFAGSEIDEGRAVMNRYFEHARLGLSRALEEDGGVRGDVFSDGFTKNDFISFIFDNLVMLAVKQAPSCDFLLGLIEKAIY
ncbi:TetR/AcrR family transcriptional regulator [Bacillota bacterium Meth-B3]|nr:TetR/AcrR family transcriptional regulator [Christensenellaceae bacterium]MEA5065508.1 TetR/AcrR family transcriptional regulator [Eubacteriales bacterium]